MISELMWTKKGRLLAATVMCTVLIAGLVIFWQMSQVAEAAILEPHPGLVGWWRFDEGEGTVAEDSSGFGNHGTIYGATSVDGKYGKALSFDGIDDYVSITRHSSLEPSAPTVEAWIKYSDSNDFVSVVSHNDGNQKYGYWLRIYNNNRIYFCIGTGTAYEMKTIGSNNVINDGVWHHVVGLYDDPYLKVYVDGVEKKSDVGSITIPYTDVPVTMGKDAGYSAYGKIIIDEVRIYNRALSAAEIQENFQKGPDFSSRLLAKVPKGTTQFIVTLSWQGGGSINITIESPSKIYTEDMVPVYQRTVYSSSSGDMLNIKRLAVSVTALSSDENWYIILEFDGLEDYRITVEVQR